MFIAVVFSIAKIWKQPKYPSTDEWIEKMYSVHVHVSVCMCVCIHTVEY